MPQTIAATSPLTVLTRSAERSETASSAGGLRAKLFGADGLDFRDVIDLVNPLHHIPLVGSIYRRLTGDTISPALRIGGGALFAGPFGAAFAAAGLAVEAALESGAGDARTDGPVNERGRAVAATPPPARSGRGGWMVAATRQVAATRADSAQTASQEAAAPFRAPRRGGWIVAAAYNLPPPPDTGRRIDVAA